MRLSSASFAMSDGKIIDANGPDADLCEVPGGLGRKVYVVGVELAGSP